MTVSTAVSAPAPILRVCAWCVREGLVVEAPHHVLSHGICPRHVATLES